jgi:hypothetical protein
LLAIHCGDTLDNNYLDNIQQLDKNKVILFRFKNEEELLEQNKIKPIVTEIIRDNEYRIILDIVLSDKQRLEENVFKKRSNYNNYGSVRFALYLVEHMNIKKEFITFYSRPEALPTYKKKFIEDTKSQNWNNPIARPSFCGMDELSQTESFIKKILIPKRPEGEKV